LESEQQNFFDSTFLTAGGSITGMNTSSSQTELVQSWGLGHASPFAALFSVMTYATRFINRI